LDNGESRDYMLRSGMIG